MNRFVWYVTFVLAAFCGGLAAQSGPEIEFQYPAGTPHPSGVADTSWGPTYVSGTYFRTVRVVNLGDATLTLDPNFTTTESNCIVGRICHGPPYGNGWQTTLAAGEWQECSLTVTPLAPGPWSFTWTVSNNDTTGGEDPYVLEFSGTGLASQVGIAPALRVLTHPVGGLIGPTLLVQPVVEALDASGQRDTSFTGPITMSLMGGAGSNMQITGTVTVNASNGVAAYYGVGVDLTESPISDVNAVFSASGLAEAHSGFQVRNFTSGKGSVSANVAGCSTSEGGGLGLLALGVLAALLVLIRGRVFRRSVGALRLPALAQRDQRQTDRS
ncbi:MAG: hypothetical protein KDB90_09535 [Planctomycetes bacterium]|nr:hypothetical protein [Planctomycetota bacterium]